MMNKEQLLAILKKEICPSLGVTEPGAVALCCSAASDRNTIDTTHIDLVVSPDIYKNCMSVGIPGFSGKGIKAAAALGATGGDFSLGLEALKTVTTEQSRACDMLLAAGGVSVSLSDNGKMLYIKAVCSGTKGNGVCIIQDFHDAIVYREKNGKVLFDARNAEKKEDADCDSLKSVTVKELVDVLETTEPSDLLLLQQGAEMNMAASAWGMEHKPGAAIGAHLRTLSGTRHDLTMELQVATCAASDVRVSGSPVSVMTCSGSGNHGITAMVPVARAAQCLHAPKEKTLRALALSCLITVYVKQFSGKLSGMCGCGVASATGVACALTYLRGGTLRQMEGSIKNMAGGITGMICDGAKESCSLKLACAVSSAVQASTLALSNVVIPDDNGIIGRTAEQTMKNMGAISFPGMVSTDQAILEVMQHCK